MGQRQSSPAGSASRSLSGSQVKKVVFNGSPSEYSGPQSTKPGLFFLLENPPTFLQESQVLWRVLTVLSRVARMGKKEDGDGVVVSSLLLGLLVLERCLVLLLVVQRLIRPTRSFCGAVAVSS